MPEFELVNPVVGGFNSTHNAVDSTEYLAEVWPRLTKTISSPLKRFHVTVRNRTSGELFHHEISEQGGQSGGGAGASSSKSKISYEIDEASVNLSEAQKARFNREASDAKKRAVERFYQMGGAPEEENRKKKKKKHRDEDEDEDSSSSSSEEVYKKRRDGKVRVKYGDIWVQPYSWWYATIYGLDAIYVPTFVSPLTPAIEISPLWMPTVYIP
jgi:hypothetical protein